MTFFQQPLLNQIMKTCTFISSLSPLPQTYILMRKLLFFAVVIAYYVCAFFLAFSLTHI